MTALLEVSGLGITFGGLRAVHDVGFRVSPGEIVSVIGPNGAGKTTLFNMISGVYRPELGEREARRRRRDRPRPLPPRPPRPVAHLPEPANLPER